MVYLRDRDGLASPGVALSFLEVPHLMRTRHDHQITLLALYTIQQESFQLSGGPHNEESKHVDYIHEAAQSYFLYWDLLMTYETLILLFVGTHRQRNFALYVEVSEMIVLLFALEIT